MAWTDASCRGGYVGHARISRARLAGTLALPGDGCLVPGGVCWSCTDFSCAARGDARPPRGRMPRAGGVMLACTDFSCAARGDARPPRGRMPRAGEGMLACTDFSCAARGDARPPRERMPRAGGVMLVMHGFLVRGSRGRSPSPGTDASYRGGYVGHARISRARLAGTLALPGNGCLVPGGLCWSCTDFSCAARGDARPPGDGCLVPGLVG